MTRCLSFGVFIFFIWISSSRSAEMKIYSTNELLKIALEHSPELKALELEATALKAKADQAGRWEDPTLEIGGEKKDEPAGATNFSRIGLSQMISRPGRLKTREEVALGAAEAGIFEKITSQTELKGRVLELIYIFQVARMKATHAKERFERLKTVQSYIKGRTFASPQRRAEASIVRAKLMVLEKDFRELEANEHAAWNSLNLYLNFAQPIQIAVPWYKAAMKFSLAELIQKAELANPEFKRQKLQAQIKEKELRASQMDGWPGLTLSGSYSNGEGANPEKNYGLGVSFPIPVLNGNRGNIRAADAIKSAEESRLTWAREKMEMSLKSTLAHYQAATSLMMSLSPDKVGDQEREMKNIDSSFKRGQVDLITYLEADSQHIETMNAILDAQVDYLSVLRDLLLLVGEAPPALEL